MGAIVSKDGDEWNEEFPQIISGHIHDNQTPQKNIYYTGSPLQHAFGDTDKRVVCIIDEKCTITLKEWYNFNELLKVEINLNKKINANKFLSFL
jgi:DNA repair exonuclease SbcCD nuclease subunit